MSIITRYIAGLYLKYLYLSTGAFVAIYLLVHFLEKIGKFVSHHGAVRHILLYFLCKIPEVFVQVSPFSVLVATLITLGVLARKSEITAMRSSGMSLLRITTPIFTIAAAMSLLVLLVGELIQPRAKERMKYLEEVKIARKSPNIFFRQSNIWYRDSRLIMRASLFEPETRTLKGVTVWRIGDGMRPLERIEAEQALMTDSGFMMQSVVSRNLDPARIAQIARYTTMPLPISIGLRDLKRVKRLTDDMGFFELRRYCRKLERSGYNPLAYLAPMHSRIAFPLASLVMPLLGIPFALRGGRTQGIAGGIGISLGIGFCYFIINAFILSFGKTGVLPPFLAAWATNFIFMAAGVWMNLAVES